MAALSHYGVLRGESTRGIQLADLQHLPLDDKEGPTPCDILVVLLFSGKTNQEGKTQAMGAMRNRRWDLCPLGALGFWLFNRLVRHAENGKDSRKLVARLKPRVCSYQVPTVWRSLWRNKRNFPASRQSEGVVSIVPLSRENANCRNQAEHSLSRGQDPSATMRNRRQVKSGHAYLSRLGGTYGGPEGSVGARYISSREMGYVCYGTVLFDNTSERNDARVSRIHERKRILLDCSGYRSAPGAGRFDLPACASLASSVDTRFLLQECLFANSIGWTSSRRTTNISRKASLHAVSYDYSYVCDESYCKIPFF